MKKERQPKRRGEKTTYYYGGKWMDGVFIEVWFGDIKSAEKKYGDKYKCLKITPNSQLLGVQRKRRRR